MSEQSNRYEKLEQIRNLGFDDYPHKFEWTHTVPQLIEQFGPKSAEELEPQPVSVKTAGRVIAVRGHGKAGFAHLSGGGSKIQVYARQDRLGDKVYELYRLLDLGDMVGVSGVMFRTRTGELTILLDGLKLLAKSFLSLPEKWHGLQDVEVRYRQRYLDLIANPDVRTIFIKRSRLISEIRRFLEERGYLEVETPMMQPVAGGATARPFRTFHEALGIPLYLRIAPELYLKRLVVGGFDRVFEINRNFRNEGISTQHNPEFTMLEFYQAYSDYRDLMDLTEEMLKAIVSAVNRNLEVEYGEARIDFGRYQRYSMAEAITRFWQGEARPSAEDLNDPARLRDLASRRGLEKPGDSWGQMLGTLFEVVVEEHLIQPTFIYDFPVELSPLSKRKDEDPRLVERFELYVAGMEIANAYSELNDPEEQLQRFKEQLQEREKGDDEAHAMDEDYVRALRYGMPPTAGEGIGIDRLTMILTNSRSIRDVILFPHMRPEEGREAASE
ncbi:MAG: lysine--tRNA ligase [Acidobacteria bacterium]|nr:MAG: lysine--tRNA ligase [Acidobacteriota bacterium]